MAVRPHRPRSVPAKAATIFVLYTVAGLFAGLVPLADLPGDWSLVLVVFLLAVAFVVGQQLVWADFWSLFAGVLTAGAFVKLTFYGAHASTLAWRGQQVQVTVTQVKTTHVKTPMMFTYTLVDARGRRVPGRLVEEADAFGIGDHLAVMVDPDGWVDPETVGEVQAARPIWTIAGAALLLVAATSLWIALSRPRGRPSEVVRYGLWYYQR